MLRAYQQEAVSAVHASWSAGKSAVLCLPTGTGKTITALETVRDKRFLFVVHRDYLLHQTKRQFGADIALLSGKHKRKEIAGIPICATQQWLSRPKNLQRVLDSGAFDALIVDETHHAVAEGWHEIIRKFKDVNPHAGILGMTATLQRADNIPLCRVFDELAYFKPIKYFCDNGYLAPVRSFTFDCDIDVSNVPVSRFGDDFVLGEKLVSAVKTSNWLEVTVDAWKEHAPGTKTLAFCLTVENSKELCAAFNSAGIPAAHVDADTPAEQRAAHDSAFRSGDILILCNVAIYTEGYDVPDAECAIMARPTKSQLYYMQCVGRVLRPQPGKTAIVLDMTDTRHTLMQFGDIEPAYQAQSERDLLKIQGFGGQFFDALMLGLHQRRGLVQFGHARDAYARIINLLRNGKLAWGVFGNRVLLGTGRGDLLICAPEDAPALGLPEDMYHMFLISAAAQRYVAGADPLDVLEKAADIGEQNATVLSDATAQWRGLPPTDAQIGLLIEQMHLERTPLEGLNRGEASLLISYIKACDALKLPIGGDWNDNRQAAKSAWLAERQAEREKRQAEYEAQREAERLAREKARQQAETERRQTALTAMQEIANGATPAWADADMKQVFSYYREILTGAHSFTAWEQEFIKDICGMCAGKREKSYISSRQSETLKTIAKRLKIRQLEKELNHA